MIISDHIIWSTSQFCGDQVLRCNGVIVYCRGHGSLLSCCDCGVAVAAAAAAAVADFAAVAVSAATMRSAAVLLLQQGTLMDYFNNTNFMKLIPRNKIYIFFSTTDRCVLMS